MYVTDRMEKVDATRSAKVEAKVAHPAGINRGGHPHYLSGDIESIALQV